MQPNPAIADEVMPTFPPTPAAVKACTANECLQGHRWPARLALVDCPGCRAQVLVVAMENCPTCNEPAKQLSMRTDHVAGGGIAAVCKGKRNAAEVTEVVMVRGHWEEAQLAAVDPATLQQKRTGLKAQPTETGEAK